jgi:hypothetical protein
MLAAARMHGGSAGAPAYLGARTRGGFGDMMIDGVSRGAGVAGRSVFRGRPAGGWRQCLVGSWPRRGASARAGWTRTRAR